MDETWTGGYEPDFVERNGAWLVTVIGLGMTCVSGVLMYFLKSRCSHIRCCGMECQRDTVELQTMNLQSSNAAVQSV